jgi:hypothetical protein
MPFYSLVVALPYSAESLLSSDGNEARFTYAA